MCRNWVGATATFSDMMTEAEHESEQTRCQPSERSVYLRHIAAIGIGLLLGWTLAYFVLLIPFDFSAELSKTRELGITSITTLNGHPKTRDLLTYVCVLGFPVAMALLLWLLLIRGDRRKCLRGLLEEEFPDPPRKTTGRRLGLFFTVLAYAYILVDLTGLHGPDVAPRIGAWPFLGEEGAILAWVQNIFSGDVFGRDYFCLYGPMMIYPLALAMKLFGTTVLTARVYTYALNALAYAIILAFLYRVLRWKGAFVISALAYILIFPPYKLAPNMTYLRVVLGVLPLLICYRYLQRREQRFLLVLAGAVAGQSLLFSQEAGVCAVLALAAFFLPLWISRRAWGEGAVEGVLLAAGCALSMAPMLTYIALKGGLVPMLANLYEYPKLATLGYGGLPFPSFHEFLTSPLESGRLFQYGMIIFYAIAIVSVVPRLLLGEVNRDRLLCFAVIAFGVLLYRINLGRSHVESAHKVAHPVFLMICIFLDRAASAAADARQKTFVRSGRMLFGALVLSGAVLVVVATPFLHTSKIKRALAAASSPGEKFRVVQSGTDLPGIERGGVFFDADTAASIRGMNVFLSRNTSPGDYVYFFPNEAAYYFLLDRSNPTRYPLAYWAVTRDQRREIVADLEEKKPRFVVYSLDTWRVDFIDESRQVPEVVQYLRRQYRTHQHLKGAVILKRAGS